MSAITRSSSSSPDVLGPPGDADYLISSPIKPFTGRQSFYSPAFSARKPRPSKRPRVSLSPTKSAHSIRFDDVLLPGSPAMKLAGRHRSPSPLKDQQDGNVSPWRIRLTLEATQDEENESEMQLSPSRKRHRPTTITTMIPLKDGRSPLSEKTPSRSRPRKPDTKPLNGSPWPASAGNTPGRPGETPKRKPGRPRKNTPRPNVHDSPMIEDEPTPAPEPLHLLETEQEPQIQFSPMDIVEDRSVEPTRHWSPLNVAENGDLDSDSLGADDLPVADLTGPMQRNGAHLNASATREYGRTTYDTPIITEQQYLDNEENINSTPSKMPSPTRERLSSSVRSARDAGMASSPQTYPTPTPTSSLAEEENQAREAQEQRRENDDQQPLSDPTEEHEEFDSIMESEGFTMVSLDTLPSAQQFGLGSNASRATDNAARVLQDRHNGRIGDRLKRKLPGISDLQSDNHSSARPSPVTDDLSTGYRVSSHASHASNRPAKISPARPVSYPDLPPTSSPWKEQPQFEEEKEEPRSDIILENESIELDDIEEEEEEEEEELDELDEVHVIPHSSQSEREEVSRTDPTNKIRSQQEAEWHKERQEVSRNAQEAIDSNHIIYIDSDQNASENEGLPEENEFSDHLQSDFGSIGEEDRRQPDVFEEQNAFSDHLHSDFGSIGEEDRRKPGIFEEDRAFSDHLQSDFGPTGEEERREPERFEAMDEQEEPEGLEQFADEDFVGSVDSENAGQSKPRPVLSSPSVTKRPLYAETEVSDGEDNGYDDIWRQEPDYPKLETRHAHEPEPVSIANQETEMEDEEDEDGFDDIWQQEARDNSHISHHSENQQHHPVEEAASPWRKIAGKPSSQNYLSSSPAYVDLEKDGIRHLNQTQIRKLREREVDLSALLAADDTPNRARYYNGTSTPRSILRSATQHSSINGSALKSQPSNPGKRVRLQPLSQSPEREPEAEQESPIFRHNYSQQEAHANDVDEIDSVHDGASSEGELAHGDITITPEHQRQSDVEPQGSSWFQRITSLTPRWLKAPAHSDDDEPSSASEADPRDISEDELEDGQVDQGELSIQSPQMDHHYHEKASTSHRSSDRSSESPLGVERTPQSMGLEQGHSEAVSSVEEEDGRNRLERSISSEVVEDNPANMIEEEHDSPKGPRPLAVFGYFSNDHYLALRRVYRIAKRHPERFPYYDAPGRAQIIGDWIWTSDGLHGVPISEAQFAIIDRFVNELSHADVQYGGSGQVEWTDADLHRRLISIIIGEQIRDERKAQANRGASVDTWQ